MIDRRHFLSFDWSLLLSAVLLMIAGIVCIQSATMPQGGSGLSFYATRQLQWTVAALLVLLLALAVDYRLLVRMGWFFYGLSIFVLLLVEVFGSEIKGAKSWIRLGPMNWQPSEQVKIFLALFLTHYFVGLKERVDQLRLVHLIVPLLLIIIPVGLILEQPDLGVALICLTIFAGMVFVAGLRYRTIAMLMLLALIGGALAFQFGLRDYQKQRVLTLFDPESDLRGSGWQTVQSKIAVGSGQIYGRGFHEGKQSQLGFIPEQHTDFIFSILAEEWGFVGSSIVLFLFLFFFLRSLRIAAQARDREGTYLVGGLVSYMAFQCLYNIAMVVGLTPITGIPLLFMSYGGSYTIGTALALGLILNVGMRRYQ
jgi:rod shape determining protein RodA